MNGMGFRQSNAWLHTWVGLLLGWLLYAVFLTGTLSFFQDEISYWMKPELHAATPGPQSAQLALQQLQKHAADAQLWQIDLPDERDPELQIQWFAPGERIGRGGGERVTLDAATGEPLDVRETRGGGFLYRFHFELYAMPRQTARWIVGIATFVMLVAIVSGVVTHKKLFKDFFTFRPAKGQRSWLDAHNATAVLALPFHFMITYSGLLLLMFMLMPWGVQGQYQGNMQAFFGELRSRGEPVAEVAAEPAALTPLAPLLEQANARWERGVASIRITRPNTTAAQVELREQGGDSLLQRGGAERLVFDGVSGAALAQPAEASPPAASAVYNVFSSLHLIRFAGPPLRWLFFVSGLLGTAMIATGLVLWVVKRLPQRLKAGRTPFGHRLVEVLNVGTIAGLPCAIAAYFLANRLLPAQLPGRLGWEINAFFMVWALCLLHPLLRTARQAWLEQLALGAALFVSLPLLGLLTAHSGLFSSLGRGDWLLVGMDLTLLATAAVLAFAGCKLAQHQPLVRAARPRPAPRQKEVAL